VEKSRAFERVKSYEVVVSVGLRVSPLTSKLGGGTWRNCFRRDSASFGFRGPLTRFWRQRRRRMSVAGTFLAINSSIAGVWEAASKPATRSSSLIPAKEGAYSVEFQGRG
jgi:hypothetical protein